MSPPPNSIPRGFPAIGIMFGMSGFYSWLWRLGPANPLAVRIVEGGSRRSRHLWVRMGYLGALILLVIFGLLVRGGFGPASLTDLAKAGTWIFATVSYGQVILICLLAPLFMAGGLAQEQSAQTYDIMLTTPMSNLQIVLGTLIGRLFFVLSLLASGLPLFAIVLVFGGVPVMSVFVAFAIAALTALLVAAVALTLAVLRRGGRKSVYVFVIAVAAYLIGCYALDQMLRAPAPGGGYNAPRRTTVLTPLHPLLVLESYVNSANYQPPPLDELADRAWGSRFYLGRPLSAFTTLSLGLSVLLIGWSALNVRSVSYNEGRIGLMVTVQRWLRLGRGDGARRRTGRTVWNNPIAWREASTRANPLVATFGRWGFVLASVAFTTWLLLAYHQRRANPLAANGGAAMDAGELLGMVQGLLWLQVTVIVLVAIYMSAGAVSREREDGTLDLILTTPVTPRYYVWGKLRGLISFLAVLLLAPVLTIGVLSLYTLVGTVLHWEQAMPRFTMLGAGGVMHAPLTPVEACLLAPFFILPFAALCVTIGMTWSLKARGVLGAVTPTVGIVGIVMLFTGFCGWQAVSNLPLIGPMLNALNPLTSLTMLLSPVDTMQGYGENPVVGRVTLIVAAVAAAGLYSLLVYTLLQSMIRTFDHTVRRLAGQNN